MGALSMRFGVVVLAIVAVAASTPLAMAQEDDTARAVAGFMSVLGDYIAPVEFDRTDIELLLEDWDEIEGLFEEEEEGDDWGDDDPFASVVDELRVSAETLTNASSDPAFRAWASSRGVDADQWMRKAMRIQLFAQRRMMGAEMQDAGDLDAQLREIESQRGDMGDEMTDAMLEMMRSVGALWQAIEALPAPTAAEERLLDEYADRIMEVSNSDEDDEYGEYGYGDEPEYGPGGSSDAAAAAAVIGELNMTCEENWCAGDFDYEFLSLDCADMQCALTFTASGRGATYEDVVFFKFDDPLVDEYGDMDPGYWERVTDALGDWEEARR